MRRGLLLTIAVMALLLGALLALREWLRPVAPTAPAPPAEVPAEAPLPEVERPREPDAPMPLAIEGRVLSGRDPVGGATVRCGDESAVTGADGFFLYPPAVRPRTVAAGVSLGGRPLVSWEGLVAGEAPRDGPDPAGPPGTGLFPSRPARIRWTFSLKPAAGGSAASWIDLGHTAAEEWGNGARIRVQGTTRLPDGAHIATSLYFDDFRFIADVEQAEAASGAFVASLFCPPDVKFYSGTYDARASFASVLELPSAKAAWAAARPAEDWESLVVPEETLRVFIGDPAEARAEDLEVEAYYTKAAGEAKLLRQVLRSRVRALRLLAKLGGDLAAWRERAPERDGWTHEDLALDGGRLNVAKWREFLDVEWRPRVKAIRDAHAERGQEKYQEAGRLLAAVLGAMLEESYAMSRFQVYPDFKVEPDERDFYPDEENAGDLIQIQRIIEGGFEALERYQRLVD
jgi:hypothetical protein